MNVQAPCWAGQIPNPQLPLSTGLRGAYEAEQQVPAELRHLLQRLERGTIRR